MQRARRRVAATGLAGALLAALATGCGTVDDLAGQERPSSASSSPSASPDPQPPTKQPVPPSSSGAASDEASSGPIPDEIDQPAPLGTVPPPWLGKRVLPTTANGFGEVRPTPPVLRSRRFTLPDTVAMLPGRGFASKVVSPPPRQVLDRSTWEPRCPVAPKELAWLRMTFHGFDDRRHTGEMLIHADVADDIVRVFRRLWDARFPLEQMAITTRAELDAPPTGDGNGTGGFVCRPVTGGTSYSQHAYGLAIDLNSFQNPYLKGDVVVPELSSAYLDRGSVRPGMITAGGPVVRAFGEIGWVWGGDWRTLKDWQHFSRNGR